MLKIEGLRKEFGATVALSGLDLEIGPGEVVGVIGENGAGKSTMMKLLSGVHQPTSGSFSWQGEPVKFKTPAEAMMAGISMVHQELNLIPTLSAEDNLFLGREATRSGSLDRAVMSRKAAALLSKVGANYDPKTLCEDLSIAEQQLVEIARALLLEAKLVIFDEPTAVLSQVETDRLLELIRELQQQNVSVLYVSHRLTEVLQVCSRIVVLRDSEKVADFIPDGHKESDLATLMVGRDLNDIYPTKPQAQGETIFEVSGLESGKWAKNVSISVRKGEILGLAGLIGAGRTESCEAIVGLRPRTGGEMTLSEQRFAPKDYRQAIKEGISYVSEDRKGKGLVTSMSVEDNIHLASLDKAYPGKSKRQVAMEWIEKLGVKVAHPSLPMTALSGGNQQKVSIAKWLATDPQILILDEPTRGVDVGAKAEIYRLIANLATQGLTCIVISSEISELLGLCHRIVVMREGHVTGELIGEDMTDVNIMRLAAGVAS